MSGFASVEAIFGCQRTLPDIGENLAGLGTGLGTESVCQTLEVASALLEAQPTNSTPCGLRDRILSAALLDVLTHPVSVEQDQLVFVAQAERDLQGECGQPEVSGEAAQLVIIREVVAIFAPAVVGRRYVERRGQLDEWKVSPAKPFQYQLDVLPVLVGARHTRTVPDPVKRFRKRKFQATPTKPT